jgi:hypothetical protein
VLGVLRLYGKTALLAARRSVRAWPVAFSLVMYAIILLLAMRLLAPLGMLGGMILGLIVAACFSSYLHLISFAVAGSKITLMDVRRSFGARFWDVISVLFAFWIIGFAVDSVVAPAAGAKADIVKALVGLAMAVFFNVVPELLYQSTSRSFILLMESGTFISKHGLEWFLPNILAALALLAPLDLLHGPAGRLVLVIANLLSPNNNGMAIYNLFEAAPPYLQLPMLAFVHWLMIFRGLLFAELTRGGSRQRALRQGWGR